MILINRGVSVKKIQIFAIVFAVLTALSIFVFLNSIKKSSLKDYIEVVVASKNIDGHTMLTADMLEIKKMPKEAVHPDAARRTADVAGLITDSKLEKGEAILRSKLLQSGKQSGGMSYRVPDGMRAVTIQVDEYSGVGGYLKTGDRVDILAEFDLMSKQSVDRTPTSMMLLQNIEVLAAGSNTSSNSKTTSGSVTLAVKPEDTLKLHLACTSGKIRLILRYPLDKNTSSYSYQVPADLLNNK